MFVGNVEARLMCFYRRSEVPASLVHLADKHHWAEVDVEPVFLLSCLSKGCPNKQGNEVP